MKVLHLINNLGSGGAEKLITDLVPLLNKENDIEVNVLLLTKKNSVHIERLTNNGIKVEYIKFDNFYSFKNIFEIVKHIKKYKYDIVHSHLFPSQYWVACARYFVRNRPVKFVTTEHSTTNRRREKLYFKLMDRFVYSKYDSIISVSKQTQENLIRWLQSDDVSNHRIIRNGVNISKIRDSKPYSKMELITQLNEDDKIICMVARFSEQKDQPTLIKAISLLPENVHLVLVGEGVLLEQNIALAKELKLSQRVHFLGFRNDVYPIMKTADVLVLSSHLEGLSLSSLEGMASGKPFVASRVPGLEELVEGSGLLFEEKNEFELSKILSHLLVDRTYYNKIVNKCVEKSNEYSIRLTVDQHIKLYKELLGEKK